MSKFSNFIKILIKSPVDKKLHFAYSALIAILGSIIYPVGGGVALAVTAEVL